MESILAALQSTFDLTQVKIIIGFITFNVVVAIAASIKNSEFQLVKIGEFLYKKLLAYILVYIASSLLGDLIGLSQLTSVAFLAILSILTGDLSDSLAKLGLNIPDFAIKPATKTSIAIAKYMKDPTGSSSQN